MLLGLVYMVRTVIIGLFFYWLRGDHRAWYGLGEIVVFFVIMIEKEPPQTGWFVLTVGGRHQHCLKY